MNESEHERRLREATARMLMKSMPDISRTMQGISRMQLPGLEISRALTRQHQEMLAAIANKTRLMDAAVINQAALRAAHITIPPLALDYKSLFPDLARISADAFMALAPSIAQIQSLQRDQFRDVIARVRAAMAASLPPNWRGEEVHIPKNLEVLLLDEGLALAWVPPEHILVRLFEADSAAERRAILRNNWRGISQACISQLETIEDPKLAEYVRFAVKGAHGLRTNNTEAAQALSANLLDTILRENFDGQARKSITGQKKRLNIDDYPLRVALVLGGIWGAHGEFWPSKGEQVPRGFSRHGSVHGVSRRQYSKVNSLLALMHVVSLLKVLETDLGTITKT